MPKVVQARLVLPRGLITFWLNEQITEFNWRGDKRQIWSCMAIMDVGRFPLRNPRDVRNLLWSAWTDEEIHHRWTSRRDTYDITGNI